jgi:anti-sigma-K factor RskA
LRFSYGTLHSWHKYGYRGVKLETKTLGKKVVSTLEAVDRFADALAQLDAQQEAAKVPADRQAEVDARLKERFGL